jgi:hypothetical protein
MLGVAAVSEDILYLTTGTSSGAGKILKSTDGAATFKTENTSHGDVQGLLYLAAAAADTNHAIATGIFEHYYTVNGFDFETSIGPGAADTGVQCAKVFPGKGTLGEPQFGIAGKPATVPAPPQKLCSYHHFRLIFRSHPLKSVETRSGTMGHFNGVGITHDGGFEYKGFGPTKAQLDPETFPARYASFASEKVWYVTYGSFPEPPPAPAPNAAQDDVIHRRLNKKVSLHLDRKTNKTSMTMDMPRPGVKSEVTGGFTAAIAKTVDAGATWEVLFTDQVRAQGRATRNAHPPLHHPPPPPRHPSAHPPSAYCLLFPLAGRLLHERHRLRQ